MGYSMLSCKIIFFYIAMYRCTIQEIDIMKNIPRERRVLKKFRVLCALSRAKRKEVSDSALSAKRLSTLRCVKVRCFRTA